MQTIVDAGREFVLGRKAIIDRSGDAARAGAQIAAHPVVSFEATQHETAAVKEHQQWEWTHAMRRVNSDAQRSARAVDGSLANTGDIGGGCHQGDARFVLRACRIDRQGMRGGHAGTLVEQDLDLRIDRHDRCCRRLEFLRRARQRGRAGR